MKKQSVVLVLLGLTTPLITNCIDDVQTIDQSDDTDVDSKEDNALAAAATPIDRLCLLETRAARLSRKVDPDGLIGTRGIGRLEAPLSSPYTPKQWFGVISVACNPNNVVSTTNFGPRYQKQATLVDGGSGIANVTAVTRFGANDPSDSTYVVAYQGSSANTFTVTRTSRSTSREPKPLSEVLETGLEVCRRGTRILSDAELDALSDEEVSTIGRSTETDEFTKKPNGQYQFVARQVSEDVIVFPNNSKITCVFWDQIVAHN
jgi:hypothetical protein